eukprot:scaffold65819_cov58-Cyclotella_meneghiniana.AAC.3
MAMVEVPGGSAIGGRSNHGRRTTPFFSRGPPRKRREASGIGKKQVPPSGEALSLYHSSQRERDVRELSVVGQTTTRQPTTPASRHSPHQPAAAASLNHNA